jgi:MSHA type pilus biogenesis protein MshL
MKEPAGNPTAPLALSILSSWLALLAGLTLTLPATAADPPPTAAPPTAAPPTAAPPTAAPPTAAPPTAAPAAVTNSSAVPVIERHAKGKILYSFRATDLDLKAALALFARANGLNIVPDPDVTGQITLDVRDLPLEQIMIALLDAHDFAWTEEKGLIRVRAYETRLFTIDYLRLTRKGTGQSSAMLASNSGSGSGAGGTGGGGMGGAGGGGGGGGGMGGGGMGGGGMGGAGGAGGGNASAVNLSQDNSVEFWKELKEELTKILTQKGKDSLAINMTAGIIQVTDRPAALRRLGEYIDSLQGNVQRQVDIEAKLYDVTLNDQFQFGINWARVASDAGNAALFSGSPMIAGSSAAGGYSLKESAFTFLFTNKNTRVLLEALQVQGEVRVISKPRVRTLNNQTALIKVGTEQPFFSHSTTYLPGVSGTGTTTLDQDVVTTITVGTILAITPQVSSNNWITLDVSPVLTSLTGTAETRSGTTAPILDIKQASTLVRVQDGNTVVMGGLIQDEHAKVVRKIPLLADIPVFGKLFQGKVDIKAKKELVMFITPTIIQ